MLPQLVLAPQAVSPAMAADVCGGSSCTPGSASANDWSAEGLLFALARAEELQLRPNVWIAVNPTEELAATHPQHTLGARLGISSTVLPVLWSAVFGGTWHRSGRDNARQKAERRALSDRALASTLCFEN